MGKLKIKLKQLLCRHKNKGWMKKKSTFQCLSGDEIFLVCKDCGKILDSTFREREGNGWK
ncbi:hypothetical protein [Fusobacterium vincentii]|jgi:hypothetical protein|uniref:Uncharacterized protein n=1 Tax=Fusobacterium vincentii TaxID=155615 RepID=A0AAJ1CRW0_FUSVC|nr:hypothetical protein [Fusobacterium vincentii]MCW0263108.1 hypothetical protein [Fusobacterium vincentii]STO29939.1 Uncharacterised protein [Fusobacterium vincentii]